MSKENVTGTIVEVSLDQIISEMLSEYVGGLKRNGEKIFATGDEFSATVDIKKYKREINDIFTDDNLRLNVNKETLKEYIVALTDLDRWMVTNNKNYSDGSIGEKAIQLCIHILKRNIL